jgi:hypothetical protein
LSYIKRRRIVRRFQKYKLTLVTKYKFFRGLTGKKRKNSIFPCFLGKNFVRFLSRIKTWRWRFYGRSIRLIIHDYCTAQQIWQDISIQYNRYIHTAI